MTHYVYKEDVDLEVSTTALRVAIIDKHFIERYCYTSNFVQRINSGNKKRSVEFTDQLEKSIPFHLGQIARSFSNGEINEDEVENMDETHFVFDLDNRKCLSFRGDQSVNYMGVVSGAEGMTVVLRVTGGVNSRIASPFFIFKSRAESYPIAGSPDNNPRVSYRTQRNGWMDGKRFVQWLKEGRAIPSLPNNRDRQLFLDNCSGHRPSAEANAALIDIRTNLCYFPANATHICQPLDSSLIYSFEQEWRKRWDSEKLRLCRASAVSNVSGKVEHPNRAWYMKTANQDGICRSRL